MWLSTAAAMLHLSDSKVTMLSMHVQLFLRSSLIFLIGLSLVWLMCCSEFRNNPAARKGWQDFSIPKSPYDTVSGGEPAAPVNPDGSHAAESKKTAKTKSRCECDKPVVAAGATEPSHGVLIYHIVDVFFREFVPVCLLPSLSASPRVSNLRLYGHARTRDACTVR